MKLTIGYLYGDLMNIYGDTGNIIALQKRSEWRGIEVELKQISVGSGFKKGDADLYFFGGGQDESQIAVAKDLIKKGPILKEEIERGVPLLSICGGYQLLGDYYAPEEGEKLKGVGIFPAYTNASEERMIGNIVIKVMSDELGVMSKNNSHNPAPITHNLLVGFENHSGRTFLNEGLPAGRQGAKPLGKLIKGFGNNGEDRTEGCIYKNAIGCYMHGSLLPKNPELADWLIKKALEVKYGKEIELKALDDELENKAHASAVKRFS